MPNDPSRFNTDDLVRRLRDSLSDIEWAVAVVPEAYRYITTPEQPADAWSVGMNLAHLVVYEEKLAGPVMEALARGESGEGSVQSGLEQWFHADCVAAAHDPLDELMARLRAARERTIELVLEMGEERLNQPLCPIWGGRWRDGALHPPGWVATKTWQHSLEHGNTILRAALFSPR